jgi:hypothetical protein
VGLSGARPAPCLPYVAQAALAEYREEVAARAFPSQRFSPYALPEQELELLATALRARGEGAAAEAAISAAGTVE